MDSPKAVRFSFALISALLFVHAALSVSAIQSAPNSVSLAALKDERLKALARRDARATQLVSQAEAKLASLEKDPAKADQYKRISNELNRIVMTGGSLTDARVKEDMAFLAAVAGDFKTPSAETLVPLKEKYKALAKSLDDLILVKDLDRVLRKHDRFIVYTSCGLWDAATITKELQTMSDMVEGAPDIPFGRSEVMRGLQDRRLVSVPRLINLGLFPHEEIYLSASRPSVGIIDETFATAIPLETADFPILGSDGKFFDIDEPNHPVFGLPFAPPISLWMKSRMLEGRIPVITFTLFKPDGLGVQDILDGKLDDYFKRNFSKIAATKQPALVGLFNQIDQDVSLHAFGSDGRQFYSTIGEAKSKKGVSPELSNKFGDPAIPDGPERVANALKHVGGLLKSCTKNVGFYTCASGFRGSKSLGKNVEVPCSQPWNKLDYFYPGDGVIDWIGVEAIGSNPAADPKGANVSESIKGFLSEVQTSRWQKTPIMLRPLSPPFDPNSETEWIASTFQQVVPTTSINGTLLFIGIPNLTLWNREAVGAFRTNVVNNRIYKNPLRFQMLDN